MNILIPLAGRGTRVQLGKPKPLGQLFDKTLIEWAISTLNIDGHYIFITRLYDDSMLNIELNGILNKLCPNCKIITINYTTQGPACSALLAKDLIDNNEPLVIGNCDQILEWNSNEFLNNLLQTNCDGCVVTYPSTNIANSYIAYNTQGHVTRTAEKEIIGDQSLNGIHYWKHGSDFVWSAEHMIRSNERVNNEFYIAPTYNHLISLKKKITYFPILSEQHWAVGIQKDIEAFKEHYGRSTNRDNG